MSIRALTCLSAFLVVAAVSVGAAGGQDKACDMWSTLEDQTIQLEQKGHANCTTNDDCTGFDCEAIYDGHGLSFGMKVLPCQDPPGVELSGYAPHVNSKNFSHVFTHKSQFRIPGAMLNFSMLPDLSSSNPALQTLHGLLEVHIERAEDGKNLIMGLIARGCVEKSCIFSKNIFNNSLVPVPECSNHVETGIKTNSVCSINELNSCGPNQVCIQEDDLSSVGLCECLSGYVRQGDGTCLSSSEDDANVLEEQNRVPKSAVLDSADLNAASSDGDAAEAGSGTVVAVVISLLVVIALIAVASFIVFRTRLTPRLRARLTNTPYEDIVIGHRSESTQNVVA